MRIICCIYKDFVRQLKAFLPSFCHLCACEMSPGWGHLITWMDPSVGHLNGILARVGGIWTIIFKKVKCPGVAGGGILKLWFDWYITQRFFLKMRNATGILLRALQRMTMKACIDAFWPNTSQANYFEGFWRITSKIDAKIQVRKQWELLSRL